MGWSSNLTRDLFMSEHIMSEPFIEKHAIYQLDYEPEFSTSR